MPALNGRYRLRPFYGAKQNSIRMMYWIMEAERSEESISMSLTLILKCKKQIPFRQINQYLLFADRSKFISNFLMRTSISIQSFVLHTDVSHAFVFNNGNAFFKQCTLRQRRSVHRKARNVESIHPVPAMFLETGNFNIPGVGIRIILQF